MTTTIGEFLARRLPPMAGTPHPERTVQQLLAFRLGCDQGTLHGFPERVIPEDIVARLDKDLAKLAAGCPHAYVFGTVPFLDWDFNIDQRAMIPRPETEALVQRVIDHYQGCEPPQRIMDLCCGSGVMGLSLAQAFPNAAVMLGDISEDALSLAKENAAQLGLLDRVSFVTCNLWVGVPSNPHFDLVVSNPPYIDPSEKLDATVTEWEPDLAFYSEHNGLAAINNILTGLPSHLDESGFAAFELGHRHAEAFSPDNISVDLKGTFNWADDPFGVPRYLLYDGALSVPEKERNSLTTTAID